MVITPYKQQERMLQLHLQQQNMQGIRIGTVDKFHASSSVRYPDITLHLLHFQILDQPRLVLFVYGSNIRKVTKKYYDEQTE